MLQCWVFLEETPLVSLPLWDSYPDRLIFELPEMARIQKLSHISKSITPDSSKCRNFLAALVFFGSTLRPWKYSLKYVEDSPKKSIYSRRNQWISSDIPVSTSCSDHHHPVTAWEGDPKRFMGRFFYPSNFGPHAYQIKGIPSTQGGNDTSLDSVHLKNSRLGALKNTQVVWQWYF